MKIYMDVCCLSRPFDDLSQPRVRLEAIAVTNILDRCRFGQWMLTAIQNYEKMTQIRDLYSLAENWLPVTAPIKTRAIFFR